jgi:hypothetical protein
MLISMSSIIDYEYLGIEALPMRQDTFKVRFAQRVDATVPERDDHSAFHRTTFRRQELMLSQVALERLVSLPE